MPAELFLYGIQQCRGRQGEGLGACHGTETWWTSERIPNSNAGQDLFVRVDSVVLGILLYFVFYLENVVLESSYVRTITFLF
jgi:hypothetical protein